MAGTEAPRNLDDKRDRTDWTTAELVAIIRDAKAGSNGAGTKAAARKTA
jgi:hypothetical protein